MNAKWQVVKKLCEKQIGVPDRVSDSFSTRESEHFIHITAVTRGRWIHFQMPLVEFKRLVALEEIL